MSEQIYANAMELLNAGISQTEKRKIFHEIVKMEISAETLYEIVSAVRANMKSINLLYRSVDTCGTGGSGQNTINTSTLSALLLAATGKLKVSKHGGRSASGNCGSADILEAMGVNLVPQTNLQIKALLETGFAFFFSGSHHPTMVAVAKLRKEYGLPTIFNLVGPLCNPCLPEMQIIGTSSIKNAKILAEVAQKIGTKKTVVITSDSGLDEFSAEPFSFFITTQKQIISGRVARPSTDELSPSISKVGGGNIEFNKKVFLSVLNGEESAFAELVILNSAYTLHFLEDLGYAEAYALAKKTLMEKAALRVFENYKKITSTTTSDS